MAGSTLMPADLLKPHQSRERKRWNFTLFSQKGRVQLTYATSAEPVDALHAALTERYRGDLRPFLARLCRPPFPSAGFCRRTQVQTSRKYATARRPAWRNVGKNPFAVWFRDVYGLKRVPHTIDELMNATMFPIEADQKSWESFWRIRLDLSRSMRLDPQKGERLTWLGSDTMWNLRKPLSFDFNEMYTNSFPLWLYSFSSRFQLQPGINSYESMVGRAIHPTLFESLLNWAGNTLGLPPRVFPHPCSIFTCCQVFQLTLLLATIAAVQVRVFEADFYEIGGGFGSMMYMFSQWALVQHRFEGLDVFRDSSWRWHSFDMKFVQYWQHWFLTKSQDNFGVQFFTPSSSLEDKTEQWYTDTRRFLLVDSDEVQTWYLEYLSTRTPSRPSIIIATK